MEVSEAACIPLRVLGSDEEIVEAGHKEDVQSHLVTTPRAEASACVGKRLRAMRVAELVSVSLQVRPYELLNGQ